MTEPWEKWTADQYELAADAYYNNKNISPSMRFEIQGQIAAYERDKGLEETVPAEGPPTQPFMGPEMQPGESFEPEPVEDAASGKDVDLADQLYSEMVEEDSKRFKSPKPGQLSLNESLFRPDKLEPLEEEGFWNYAAYNIPGVRGSLIEYKEPTIEEVRNYYKSVLKDKPEEYERMVADGELEETSEPVNIYRDFKYADVYDRAKKIGAGIIRESVQPKDPDQGLLGDFVDSLGETVEGAGRGIIRGGTAGWGNTLLANLAEKSQPGAGELYHMVDQQTREESPWAYGVGQVGGFAGTLGRGGALLASKALPGMASAGLGTRMALQAGAGAATAIPEELIAMGAEAADPTLGAQYQEDMRAAEMGVEPREFSIDEEISSRIQGDAGTRLLQAPLWGFLGGGAGEFIGTGMSQLGKKLTWWSEGGSDPTALGRARRRLRKALGDQDKIVEGPDGQKTTKPLMGEVSGRPLSSYELELSDDVGRMKADWEVPESTTVARENAGSIYDALASQESLSMDQFAKRKGDGFAEAKQKRVYARPVETIKTLKELLKRPLREEAPGRLRPFASEKEADEIEGLITQFMDFEDVRVVGPEAASSLNLTPEDTISMTLAKAEEVLPPSGIRKLNEALLPSPLENVDAPPGVLGADSFIPGGRTLPDSDAAMHAGIDPGYVWTPDKSKIDKAIMDSYGPQTVIHMRVPAKLTLKDFDTTLSRLREKVGDYDKLGSDGAPPGVRELEAAMLRDRDSIGKGAMESLDTFKDFRTTRKDFVDGKEVEQPLEGYSAFNELEHQRIRRSKRDKKILGQDPDAKLKPRTDSDTAAITNTAAVFKDAFGTDTGNVVTEEILNTAERLAVNNPEVMEAVMKTRLAKDFEMVKNIPKAIRTFYGVRGSGVTTSMFGGAMAIREGLHPFFRNMASRGRIGDWKELNRAYNLTPLQIRKGVRDIRRSMGLTPTVPQGALPGMSMYQAQKVSDELESPDMIDIALAVSLMDALNVYREEMKSSKDSKNE